MDEETLQFWRNHSVRFIEMALSTDKRERLAAPDGYGKSSRECGDGLEIFLSSREETIRTASFMTDGCIYTAACANALVRIIEGKTVLEAMAVTPRDLADHLETLPKAEFHCAEMAVSALRSALIDLQGNLRQPWKKFYRTS
jgi:nitrogen fixation NifU-like protein